MSNCRKPCCKCCPPQNNPCCPNNLRNQTPGTQKLCNNTCFYQTTGPLAALPFEGGPFGLAALENPCPPLDPGLGILEPDPCPPKEKVCCKKCKVINIKLPIC